MGDMELKEVNKAVQWAQLLGINTYDAVYDNGYFIVNHPEQ